MAATAIFIDQREPQWVQSLRFGGVSRAVTMLDYGDLWASTDDGAMVCIERKTVDDLLNSIADERLWHQLAGIREQSPWSYLVICGAMSANAAGLVISERGATGWNWASLQGALVQAQELGVCVVHVPTDAEYEAAVLRLCNRAHTAEVVLRPPRRAAILSAGEQILASLPGIGLEKAQHLASLWGSAARALAWLSDDRAEGERVAGIGGVTKRRIRSALGLSDNAYLDLVDKSSHETVDPWDEKEQHDEQQLARSA